MSDEDLIWIEVGKIGDYQVPFTLWVKREIVGSHFVDENKNLQLPVRKDCGNCYVIMSIDPNSLLKDRCKVKGLVGWQPIGDDSPKASDKMQIAWFISNKLPNQEFVEDFKTLDQLYAWMEWKNSFIWVAKCFLAGHSSPDNPLLRPLEEGEIDQYYHDFCWLTVDLYENLWKLISLKTRRIRAIFNKQGWALDSPRQLLEEIIASGINGEFSNFLKPRYERNAKELTKIAKLARRTYIGFLPQKDREELVRLKEKHSQPNVWLKRLIDVSRLLGEKDEFISVRVAIHDEIMKGICNLQINASCKPEWRQHGQLSEIWTDGVKKLGLNNGWRP